MSNREELTRQAEKCLRQGRVDEAIALYQDLAELTPVDWGCVKQLADLLERAGQREGAARQFARWADYLFAEGFHSKAAALYKKVLKLEAFDEHALWQLAEVSVALKLRADARVAYQRVLDIRQRRGDTAGAAAARERLAELDLAAPTAAANPSVVPLVYATPEPSVVPDTPTAVAASVPAEAVVPSTASAAANALAPAPVDPPPPVQPPPESSAERLARLRREAADADARQASDAEDIWLAVLDADPADASLRMRLVQAGLDRGDLDAASRLASRLEGSDDGALALLIELGWRQCRPDAVDRLVTDRIQAGSSAASLQHSLEALAARDPHVVRAALASAVAAWVARAQHAQASSALEHGAARGWLSTALHLRWVEVCQSANLPALSQAQAALVRAYVAERRLDEARNIAEDLFVRDRGVGPARGALVDVLAQQGVADPHQVLADLLAPPAAQVSDDRVETIVDLDALGTDFDSDAWMLETMPPVADAPFGVEAAPAEPGVGTELLATHAVEPVVFEPPVAVAAADVASLPASAPAPTPAPAPAPAPVSAAHAVSAPMVPSFDWADLLGRDVAGVMAAVEATPVEPAPIVAIESPPVLVEEIAAPEPDLAAAWESMPVAEPDPVPVLASDPAAAVEDRPVAEPDPQPASAAAPESEPEPVVQLEVDAPATDAPRIGDLSGQPFFEEAPPLQPSFSMPSSWLSGTHVPLSDDALRRRLPGDDFFFTDDATPPRWAAPPLRAAVAGAPTPPVIEPSVSREPQELPVPAPAAEPVVVDHVFEAIAPPILHDHEVAEVDLSVAGVGHDEPAADALLIDADDEVDLTQLLEELKQWDPALPEMRRETPAAPPAESLVLPPAEPVVLPPVEPVALPQIEHAWTQMDDALPEPVAAPPGDAREELDAVFADLQRHGDERAVAEQQLAAGRVFLAAGLASEAARAFERASAEPRARFEASLSLGDLHKSRGQLLEAVGWYEQAAMAPVPDAAVKRPVLYDLVESLEALGETDRALGVLLDLLSQVEDYRDARARLDRLLRVDAGG